MRDPLPELDRDMTEASDEQLLRVVGIIDALDRRGPVDVVLTPVRSRLALLRPPRPITLGRVLILPFEDLLVEPDEVWPGRRCFSRAHLGWLVERVTGELGPALRDMLRELACDRTMLEADAVLDIGKNLWPAAAEIAKRGAGAADRDTELREQLSGVTPLLDLGATLVPAIWALPPRPMATLEQSERERLINLVRRAVGIDEAAAEAVLDVLVARSSSLMVLLAPLRHANMGVHSSRCHAILTRLVRRRIAEMREVATRLAGNGGDGTRRPSATQVLRLVADLEDLASKWPVSAGDASAIAEIRQLACAGVGAGIEAAVGQEILGPLASLRQPDGLSDDQAERLEEAARHTRRLSIAGAKLGLARVPDGMLDPFLPAIGNVIRGDGGTSTRQRELLEQLRVVEIMFGSDTASKLFEDLRGLTSSRAAN